MEQVQTKRDIVALLGAASLRPRRSLGQHFLIDGNLMRRLFSSAELGATDVVVEVGGGTGGLTDLLAARVGRLICVEIDSGLVGILEDRFRDAENVTIVRGDVLCGKHHLNPQIVRAIRANDTGTTSCVKLVANLPYQVATPLVMNLLTDYPQVRCLCFTVQAEVGARFHARSHRKAYGPLSIVSQALCNIRTLVRVPPSAFWPKPGVDSVMIRMDVGDSPFGDRDELRRFVTLVRATFEHRRKTLHSALAYVIDDEQRSRVCQRFDGRRRPESFTVGEWLEIHRTTQRGPSKTRTPRSGAAGRQSPGEGARTLPSE